MTGSAPGTLAPIDWKKWFKTVGYLVGSAMLAAGISALTQFLSGLDLTGIVFTVPVLKLEITATQVVAIVINLLGYLGERFARDTRASA